MTRFRISRAIAFAVGCALGVAIVFGLRSLFPAAPAPHPRPHSLARVVIVRAASGELPPECIEVRVSENSGNGPYVYLIGCGQGSAADSPFEDWAKTSPDLILNAGTTISAVNCTQASPCYLTSPKGPVEKPRT
jgi:hypothetical protein